MKLFVASLMLLGALCFTEALVRCGTKANGNGRISGGNIAKKGSWPWQVAVGKSRRRNQNQFCGGSIIAPNWIVTAAHCFKQNPKPRRYIVTAGEYNIRRKEGDEQVMEVEKIISHPNYNRRKDDYDIALMKLKKNVTYNDNVRPVCLPSRRFPFGTNCFITGWGIIHKNKTKGPSKLRQAMVPLVSKTECRRKYTGLTPRMICAGFKKGSVDACGGDSGGPLVCKNRSGDWDLAGVVSFGKKRCRRYNTYGVYANVVNLKGWVESTMNSS